jgi:hypothetical protein
LFNQGSVNNSCHSEEKPNNTINADVSTWFNWARGQRIVLAMSGRVVYTPNGKAYAGDDAEVSS